MIAAGWVAIALAVVIVVTVVCLVLLFTVGGVFGPMNDVGNALIGILSATLAVLLLREAGGWVGVAASLVGAVFAILGSWLVLSGTTSFVLAGFVSSIGFGLIGAWLALVAWDASANELFGPIVGLARIAAVAMIVGGLVAIPGALMRVDSYASMPAWLWAFSLGWIGVYVLMPVVLVGLGRRLLGM